MELEYKGGNCVVMTYKKESFVIDPRLSHLGLKDHGQAKVHLLTQAKFGVDPHEDMLVIDGPGEYEVRDCSIRGVAAQAHTDHKDAPKTATMYRFDLQGISMAVLGHIDSNLSEEQLEPLSLVDLLVVPVGGHGYTLDAKAAVDLVRKIEPKIVIPTHFNQEGIKYEVPQDNLEEFTKELGAAHETASKLKIKAGTLPATLTVYELTRSK